MILSKKIYRELKKEKRQIDYIMWMAGIVGPLTMVPQVVIVYVNKSANNISLMTWLLALLLCVIYLLYGLVHKIKPLIVANILWITLYIIFIAGIIIYN